MQRVHRCKRIPQHCCTYFDLSELKWMYSRDVIRRGRPVEIAREKGFRFCPFCGEKLTPPGR